MKFTSCVNGMIPGNGQGNFQRVLSIPLGINPLLDRRGKEKQVAVFSCIGILCREAMMVVVLVWGRMLDFAEKPAQLVGIQAAGVNMHSSRSRNAMQLVEGLDVRSRTGICRW